MTKAEITAKARVLTIKNVTDGKSKYYSWGVYKGCVVGLEYNNKQIADLEKENAELKEKVNILDNCDRLGDVITEAYKDRLTKAKEIIKDYMIIAKGAHTTLCGVPEENRTIYVLKLNEEAEQFLKENSTYERIQKAKYNYTN